MKIERIVSFANAKVRLEFLAMERSLRATGCDLPLLVIPFDDNLFELPKNAEWWRDEVLFSALTENGAVPHCRKFTAFLNSNSAFFDSDIIHLLNPVKWLDPLPQDVFVVADTEWSKARWTFTPETKALYQDKTTLWLLDNFNSGFFAFSKPPASTSDISRLMQHPNLANIAKGASPTRSEQEGANFLLHESGMDILNLCLPPHRMESTMACDYPDDYGPLLRKANSPAFVHYAGVGRNRDRPVTQLIYEHLTKAETAEMRAEFEHGRERARRQSHWPLWVRVVKRIIPYLDRRFCIQWNDSRQSV